MKHTSAPIIREELFLKETNLQIDKVYGTVAVTTHITKNIRLANARILYVKRLFDIIFSSLLILLLLSCLLPLIALFIKLDSKGPVFFLQKRKKRMGKTFTCFKFRTMILNEEADTLPAYEDDHRITRVGKFLRYHHLDELPQLFNVWWGDMSLIGPRPYMISDNTKFEQLAEQYPLRYAVKPGITGLAQVSGCVGAANIEDVKESLRLDIYYIHHWSFLLDCQIACYTFFQILGLIK